MTRVILDAEEFDQLRGWIEWVVRVKDEPCRYDHHDLCQAHNLNERPCPVEEMRAWLGVNL